MAIMSDVDRASTHAESMREIPGAIGITKAELRAAVDAVDQWVSDNATSFNNNLPATARAALTAPQKAWLLSVVLARRYRLGT